MPAPLRALGSAPCAATPPASGAPARRRIPSKNESRRGLCRARLASSARAPPRASRGRPRPTGRARHQPRASTRSSSLQLGVGERLAVERNATEKSSSASAPTRRVRARRRAPSPPAAAAGRLPPVGNADDHPASSSAGTPGESGAPRRRPRERVIDVAGFGPAPSPGRCVRWRRIGRSSAMSRSRCFAPAYSSRALASGRCWTSPADSRLA